jgi:opacity protein-like surface antigen
MKVFRTIALGAITCGITFAQQELPKVAFNIGAGFTTPTAVAGDRLDRGWNIAGAIGYNFHPNFALTADLAFNNMGVNRTTLNALSFPNGSVKVWSATLNPVVHLVPRSPVDVYITGGYGFYQWRQQFTTPTTQTFTGFDPYFGILYPVAVPVNVVVSSNVINKGGFNGGLGVAFGTKWKAKAYAEARFHRMIMGTDHYVDLIPVTFGLRW